MGREPLSWQHCELYQKLRRVLWIPYFFDKTLEPQYWRLSDPILWSPSVEEETILREDWYELMSRVQMGQLDQIDARLGQYLQIRPKAMNADVRTQGIGSNGECVRTSPRGFYLRTSFTARIID
jgi:DNA mismatch repair protein MutH